MPVYTGGAHVSDDLIVRPSADAVFPAGNIGWTRITESVESTRSFRRAVRLLRQQSNCSRPRWQIHGRHARMRRFRRWLRGFQHRPCGRCGKKARFRDAEVCWYCTATLCYDCWDQYGHCGHPEADDFERR